MFNIKYLFLFFLISSYAIAQPGDHLTPLRTNHVLVQNARDIKKAHKLDKIGPPPINPVKTVTLPFLDDFSKPGPYPDPNLWQDKNAFVNYTYPMAPHTLGVATLDGVNSIGMPYDSACPLDGSYPADTLTSQLIQLGYDAPGDSLYFSFYYQPGGYGPLEQPYPFSSFPKTNDTIILEFFNGNTWQEVWYHLGYTPVANDTNFHFVKIMMDTLPQFYINGFQFRFRNYANTSGNLDHWNIDEVYLNRFQKKLDTFQYDVAFVYESPSLLNNYSAMPWEQVTAADFKTSLNVPLRQNDTATMLINTPYDYDSMPAPVRLPAYFGPFNDVPTYFTSGYYEVTGVPLPFTFTPLTGPLNCTFTQYLTEPVNFDQWNDTLKYNQVFSDYYAYDDGTAEAGYTIVPWESTTAYFASQFTLNKRDSLVGVYIFFNYVLSSAVNCTFHLAVWNDGGGHPGTMVHEEDTLYSPKYGDSLDQFIYYPLHFLSGSDTVLNAGTFYIGWQQIDGDSLNVGFDWNTNNQDKAFYNLDPTGDPAGWNYCSYPGSVMIRPVFAGKLFNSINELSNTEKPITLYPNPASDQVNLSPAMLPNTLLQIYGADGRLVFEDEHFSGNHISTANLPEGFYIVELTPRNGKAQFQKLLISR